jgi:S-methylmethionine-dependent homocysteine/selenocysteine methylase
MKIGRAKAVDLIDLPDLTELNEAIAIHKNLFASNEPKLINGLTINNDVVEIKPNYLQHIEDIYSIYAESQKEIEVFEAHKELVNCINTIKKIFPLNGLTTLDELCMFDVKDNKATIRTYYWKKNFRHILSEREPKG